MTTANIETLKTPFYDYHLKLGAKMVDFAGFKMPIQYKGIRAEHLAVRKNVGLFDLSHMGEFQVSGKDALQFLQKTTTNNVASLADCDIQYTCMTKEDGGIVDDLLLYKMPSRYMLIVNASNIEKDFNWLNSQISGDVRLRDISPDTALLAIQGPKAQKVLSEITAFDLDSMKYYSWALTEIGGQELLFSRTGYTGEDGFEIYIHPDQADKAWDAVTDAGDKHGMEFIGLAARDSLRLEMKMALYGNDIDETTTPVEAGLSWIVDFDKDFIGKGVLLKQKEEKPKRRLVSLELTGKAFPRKGYDIIIDNEVAGVVTSGTVSPSLDKPIALGYVPRSHAKIGSEVFISIRDKLFPAKVVKPPFYKNASHK